MDFEQYYTTSGVCTDTRKITKDCLFICLKGANFNGNTFAEQAMKEGAKYVIVDEEKYATQPEIFYVPNALKYLQDLAHYHRKKFDLPIIGITGSNGKTSTKELINAVLSTKYNVLATAGNLNNHIGVPLTVLQINEQHEIAIIEMGASKHGDIKELADIAEPTIGIITNIGKAHLEGFKNFEGVLTTKKELYDSIEKNRGKIVVNSDDSILKGILPKGISTISYGESKEATVSGTLDRLSPFIEMTWSKYGYQSESQKMKMIGKYNFYNYLAAIAFGVHFELSAEQINTGICNYTPTNNRSQVQETEYNTLILDCYNANPSSMKSALESFSLIDHENKLVIIGDMLELGEESKVEHEKIIQLVADRNIQTITVGPIFDSIEQSSSNKHFKSKEEAQLYITEHPLKNKLILLKGSRGIGLETLEKFL